jgi:hypothetical protein
VVGTRGKLTEPTVFTHPVCGGRAVLLHASHRVQVPEALQVRLAHSTRVLADKPRHPLDFFLSSNLVLDTGLGTSVHVLLR